MFYNLRHYEIKVSPPLQISRSVKCRQHVKLQQVCPFVPTAFFPLVLLGRALTFPWINDKWSLCFSELHALFTTFLTYLCCLFTLLSLPPIFAFTTLLPKLWTRWGIKKLTQQSANCLNPIFAWKWHINLWHRSLFDYFIKTTGGFWIDRISNKTFKNDRSRFPTVLHHFFL